MGYMYGQTAGSVIGARTNWIYNQNFNTFGTWTSYKLEVEEEFYNEIGRFGWPVFTGWAYASGTINIYPTTTATSTNYQPITWVSTNDNNI